MVFTSRFNLNCVRFIGASLTALLINTGMAAAQDASLAGKNWNEYHGDYRGWRYSPLEEINTTNVGKLKIAWMHQPGDITHGLQATPIVIDGVLYYIGIISARITKFLQWMLQAETKSGVTPQPLIQLSRKHFSRHITAA